MSKKALLQKRADLVSEAQANFDRATAEGRGLTEAEAARDDAITAELDALAGDLQRIERQEERLRAVGSSIDKSADLGRSEPARNNPNRFNSLGEQMMAVVRAGHPDTRAIDPRLSLGGAFQAATGMSEGISADGGFLVQTDFQSELLENAYQGGEILSRIRRIPISANSNGIAMNGVDETSRVNGSRWGGIRAYWTGEAALITASQPKFRKIRMDLEKLTGMCYATDELLKDSTALGSWLTQAFSDEFTFKIEDAVMNGTGAGMPLGFLNSGATITVAKEASQAAATLVAENIMKMWTRMPARSRKNAVWLINQDVEPQLYQFNVKIKNVAGTENVGGIQSPVVYQPPGTNGSSFGTLMGRPIIPVEYCSTLGTAGDIVLTDLTQYLAIDKSAIESASSIHVRFLYDETAFRFVYRFNGQPMQQAPITPYKGTTTQSPFVVLQTR